MFTVSAVIPATSFLQQFHGGLTGIARSVILADLAGATTIWIVGPKPVADWNVSFADRGRPLPSIILLPDALQIPPPAAHERRVEVPGACLLTPEGMRALCNGDALGSEHRYMGNTPAEITQSILRSTIKPTDGWVGRHLNRPVSTRISALLLPTGIGPTPITWFSLLLAAVMVAMLGQGTRASLMVGGALFQVISTIDGVDGEIARSTYRFSTKGALLDTICDMLANIGFAIGLMLGLIKLYGQDYAWFAGSIGVLAGSAVAFMLILLRLGPRKGSFDVLRNALAQRLEGWPRLRSAVLVIERLFKRDAYALFGALMCMAGMAWILPRIIVGGIIIWLLAIAWCAPLIAADKEGHLLPAHLRGL